MNRTADVPSHANSPASSLQNADLVADGAMTRRDRGVTFRVVVICLLLAMLFGYAIPITNYKFENTYLGATHLPAGAIAALIFVLCILNPVLKLASKRWALSRNETLTVYISCLFSSLVPGRGGENYFIPNVLATFYYATYSNKWFDKLAPYIQPWMTPALNADGTYNELPVSGWYVGGTAIPWGAWLVPIVAWALIIFALYAMLGCLGVMLRAQWAEHESLAFPLLRLPQEMTRDMDKPASKDTVTFFQNRLMWLGFAVAVFIETLNGLHLYFPDVPAFDLQVETGGMFTEAPWNQMGSLGIRVWILALGVSYLLTTEVAFSLWFFFLFHKFQYIVAHSMGFPPTAMPVPTWTRGLAKSFISYQQIGAYFAYVLLLFWIGRGHFTHVFRRAIGRAQATESERQEALSYPVAFWGFVLAFLFIIGWTVAAGVQPGLAVVMWVTYLVIALGLTRVVAEGGLLLVHTGWSPLAPIAHLTGSWISPASGVPAAYIGNSLMAEMRGFLLPSFLQSFKLARDSGIAARPLLGLIATVILVSFVTGIWSILALGHREGALTLTTWWTRGGGPQSPPLAALEIVGGVEDNYFANWSWFSLGAFATWGMTVMRARYPWFPFHPIGYIMMPTYSISSLWFSVFLAWLTKSLVLRFGGSDSYKKTVPFFLGLALGDFAMIIFWLFVDGWFERTRHYLLPA
jgi:hypothetical protein